MSYDSAGNANGDRISDYTTLGQLGMNCIELAA